MALHVSHSSTMLRSGGTTDASFQEQVMAPDKLQRCRCRRAKTYGGVNTTRTLSMQVVVRSICETRLVGGRDLMRGY